MPGRTRKRAAASDVETTSVNKSSPKKSKESNSQVQFSVQIEHWATAIADALREKYGVVEVELNPAPPRRGSFECKLIKDDGSEVLVWTGLKKGPPRKLKFPEDPDVVVKALEKALT